jgi:hypothetical protein
MIYVAKNIKNKIFKQITSQINFIPDIVQRVSNNTIKEIKFSFNDAIKG